MNLIEANRFRGFLLLMIGVVGLLVVSDLGKIANAAIGIGSRMREPLSNSV